MWVSTKCLVVLHTPGCSAQRPTTALLGVELSPASPARRRAQARPAAEAVGDAIPGRPGGAGAAAYLQVPRRHQAPPQWQARGCRVIPKLLARLRSGLG